MQQHLVADIVEQYVIGALDAESVRFVEGHVAQCPACARLLEEEAQLELSLVEVAKMGRVVSVTSRRRRMGALAASVLALAAGVAVVFDLSSEPAETARPQVRRCDDTTTASACISKAQFDGVITLDAEGQPIIPRYDVASTGGQP